MEEQERPSDAYEICGEYSVEVFEPLSIMRASAGERAIYRDETSESGFFGEQVLFWALCRVVEEWRHPRDSAHVVRRDVSRRIVGMTTSECGIECVELQSNFLGYATAGDTDDAIRGLFSIDRPMDQPMLIRFFHLGGVVVESSKKRRIRDAETGTTTVETVRVGDHDGWRTSRVGGRQRERIGRGTQGAGRRVTLGGGL